MTRPTILVVTPESTRTLDVDLAQLSRLRSLRLGLYALGAVLLALICALAVLAARHGLLPGAEESPQVRLQREEAQQQWQAREQALQAREQALETLRQQIDERQQAADAELQTKLADLKKSEQLMGELQAYLKARGVNVKLQSVEPPKGRPNPAAGGPRRYPALPVADADSGRLVALDAGNLLQALQSVPLGLPHNGPLSSRFGNRANPFTGKGSEFHGGLDFKGSTGQPIKATASGKVGFAGVQSGYGKVVIVEHANGYSTLYAHLSRIDVKAGERIQAGQTVGLLGNTGRSSGPHLHYEVQLRGERLDPEHFLSLATPRGKNGPVAVAPAHAIP